MSWREILMIVRSEQEIDALISQAQRLLDPANGHVTGLTVVAEPIIPASVGIELPAGFIQEQMDAAREQAHTLQAMTAKRLERHGLKSSSEVRTSLMNYQERLVALSGRHADLVLVGQVREDEDRPLVGRLVEATFMSTGRPALVVPYIAKDSRPIDTVMVAWDGSREASRALHDALPVMKTARRTVVVVVDGASLGDQIGEQPGADIGRHLAHHGIDVEVTALASGGLRVGDVLLSHVADCGADLLVMGGYGHARLREMILGGATRSLLDHMTVPVLISH